MDNIMHREELKTKEEATEATTINTQAKNKKYNLKLIYCSPSYKLDKRTILNFSNLSVITL